MLGRHVRAVAGVFVLLGLGFEIVPQQGVALAQSPLPVVAEGDLVPLRANCQRLLKALDSLGAPLPAETQKALHEALKPGSKDTAAFEEIQKLLDPHCLVGITINPESRVKVARGPAKAELQQGQWMVFLAKVHNEAGVTRVPSVTGPHLLGKDVEAGSSDERWLQADVFTKSPMREQLTGHAVEYVILRFNAQDSGKREARLIFDVGQGTQDLGFRAEVPILFVVKPRS